MAENLKCSVCGKDATVHLTQIVNNKIHKVDLCEDCAQKKGVTDPEGFSLADLLSKSSLHPVQSHSDLVCPTCGATAADFKRTGRMGCSKCYDTFGELIKPVLEEMHSGTTHVGKVPERALERYAGRAEIERLQAELEKAVNDEAYELAAKYRDQIKAAQEALSGKDLNIV